jgi:hypothetical protein
MRRASTNAVRKYEAKQIARIQKWRQRRPGWMTRTTEWLTTPVVWTFHKIIPTDAVEATLEGNIWVAHRWTRERSALRALRASSFAELADSDLVRSDRVARKVHRGAIYLASSLGFVSGMFGFFALPVGMAGALNIALRTIRQIGLCYGYAAPSEAERLFAYYTLSLAGNRAPAEKTVSLDALRELQAMIAAAAPAATEDRAASPDQAPDKGAAAKIRQHALGIAHHDFSREITKQLVQVRLLTSIPVIGAVIGVFVDANYIRSVGWAARHSYQLRWLRDRGRLLEWASALPAVRDGDTVWCPGFPETGLPHAATKPPIAIARWKIQTNPSQILFCANQHVGALCSRTHSESVTHVEAPVSARSLEAFRAGRGIGSHRARRRSGGGPGRSHSS